MGRRALILGSAVAAVTVAGAAFFLKGGTEVDPAKASVQKSGGKATLASSRDSERLAEQSSRAAKGESAPANLPEGARNQAANRKNPQPPSVAGIVAGSGADRGSQTVGSGSLEETERFLKTLSPNMPLSTGEEDQDEAGNAFVADAGSGGGAEPTPTPPLTPEETTLLLQIENTATKDGAKAAAWVDSLEPNIFKEQAIEYVNHQWQMQNPQAATQWYEKATAKPF